jgi:hypothetical protein
MSLTIAMMLDESILYGYQCSIAVWPVCPHGTRSLPASSRARADSLDGDPDPEWHLATQVWPAPFHVKCGPPVPWDSGVSLPATSPFFSAARPPPRVQPDGHVRAAAGPRKQKTGSFAGGPAIPSRFQLVTVRSLCSPLAFRLWVTSHQGRDGRGRNHRKGDFQ